MPPNPAGITDHLHVSRDSLPLALQDKNWKVRAAAFEFLSNELLSIVSSQADASNIDVDLLLPGLGGMLPTLLDESNAGALDKALDFAHLYAEHCRSAGDAEQASRIVSSLVQKHAFSSRPSTLKSAHDLSLALMEVGTSGVSSVHAVINVLLAEGLASRKPKVVQASASLIHDAALEFGASKLPLAPILLASPKLLSHSNPSVRSSALHILAEICRALGSKSHVQEVLDKMKKSQLSELDTMLAEKPEASPPRRQLRSMNSPRSCSSSPGDVVAALQENAKELAAQRFAAKPSINLMQQLANTDYASRIGMTKWSEKVAALNDVLECAGEKPYKLVPQSTASNYAPLISELKKLLGHTHFAVCTKSTEVLAVLAQGVGETLFPYLRPLLVTLLKLSKDKKLTISVNRCLDSFFGNVLSLDHLLDGEESLPLVADENNEKNALSRATAMEFLVRCIQRNASSGPRGSLSKKSAEGIASLCFEKLGDSSAAVRKASIDALKALRECEFTEVKEVAISAIESLKEKNPRAYRGLSTADLPHEGGPQGLRKKSESTSRKASLPIVDGSAPDAKIPQKQKSEQAFSVGSRPVHGQVVDAPKVSKSDSLSDEPPLSIVSALVNASSLRIPLWDAPEDNSGVLAGLACK
jgi:cytoskeleton-associated protein 5